MPALSIRSAVPADLVVLQPLIQRAYRGETSRSGWTHEADIIPDGERIDLAELRAMLADPNERILIGWIEQRQVGCVRVAKVDETLAYLGLLCVDPLVQAGGYGKLLIAAAEDLARTLFDATRIEMTVIEQRRELIDFYRRRGYRPTGERRDFPVALEPLLFLTVLEKPLA